MANGNEITTDEENITDPEKLFDLGEAYFRGKRKNWGEMRKEQNIHKGFALITKAAEMNNISAMDTLGMIYKNGLEGFPIDMEKAMYWLEKAGEQPVQESFHTSQTLGEIYAEGEGIPKNIDKAIYWYGKAANLGSSLAKGELEKLKKMRGDAEPAPQSNNSTSTSATIFCMNCGTQLPATAKFCNSCGKPIQG